MLLTWLSTANERYSLMLLSRLYTSCCHSSSTLPSKVIRCLLIQHNFIPTPTQAVAAERLNWRWEKPNGVFEEKRCGDGGVGGGVCKYSDAHLDNKSRFRAFSAYITRRPIPLNLWIWHRSPFAVLAINVIYIVKTHGNTCLIIPYDNGLMLIHAPTLNQNLDLNEKVLGEVQPFCLRRLKNYFYAYT